MDNNYTAEEAVLIVRALNLLSKNGFPVPPDVFDAWCGACVASSIELAVLRTNMQSGEQEVLMIYRDDRFFHGWHIPGTIILPGDTEESAMTRLLAREVGAEVTTPQFVDRSPVARGNGPDQCPRGQEIGHLFVCSLTGSCSGHGSFFTITNPPKDTLGHHKHLLKQVVHWQQNAQR